MDFIRLSNWTKKGFLNERNEVTPVIEFRKDSITGQYLSGKRQIPVPAKRRTGSGKSIVIKGASENNLKNINLTLPKNKLIVMTGLSGSGKSSLAFDTIYQEGQRRFVESLSSYARQFLGGMEKPDVDNIEGLSPAISIDQKTTSKNPRSTVGTVTEIYDYLRLLYARVGIPHCPICGKEISQQATLCVECYRIKSRKVLRPELKDL